MFVWIVVGMYDENLSGLPELDYLRKSDIFKSYKLTLHG